MPGFLAWFCFLASALGEDVSCLLSLKATKVVIFYHLWLRGPTDTSRVAAIAREQLSLVNPKRQHVLISSLGPLKNIAIADLDLPAEVEKQAQLSSYVDGGEDVTLHRIWSFCKDADPSQVVAYLHSKGSYSNTENNTRLRKYLTRGVLSEGCQNLPSKCDVCSSRMSPVPHPHYSGNMWTARCGYIAKLKDPVHFPTDMDNFAAFRRELSGIGPSCIGLGRYALEHWVNSHPEVRPCDVDAGDGTDRYSWNYDHIPAEDFPQLLHPAPRFDLDSYLKPGLCAHMGDTCRQRVAEYKFLYNQTPPTSWWGWKFFADSYLYNQTT
ncbi:unnamed protein product [Effrenium voratum]|nr:unnamed protein product [Effrenium voratum]